LIGSIFGNYFQNGRVLDGATRRPTPVRLAFRSRDGRYIPPYGHRREINNGWFQDYGGDLKLRRVAGHVLLGDDVVGALQQVAGIELRHVRVAIAEIERRELRLPAQDGRGRRGGLRSHSGSGGRTYDQLRNEAKERGIKGRSKMSKAQLESVLSR